MKKLRYDGDVFFFHLYVYIYTYVCVFVSFFTFQNSVETCVVVLVQYRPPASPPPPPLVDDIAPVISVLGLIGEFKNQVSVQ